MPRKKTAGAPAPPSGGTRVTPTDVQQVEFRLAFRGYNERDVDAFLDRVTEDLAWYMEENQRLRATGSGTPPVAGTGSDADAEAARILTEARAEADRLVREAEARAAAVGSAGGDPRSAVAPFLNREREFLQSLGALVQGHAEEVKGMALALREQSSTSARPEGLAPVTAAAPTLDAPAEPDDEPTPDAGQPEPTPDAGQPEPAATSEEEAFAPISVPEAEAGDEPIPAAKPGQLRRDSGERSLRELFWGED